MKLNIKEGFDNVSYGDSCGAGAAPIEKVVGVSGLSEYAEKYGNVLYDTQLMPSAIDLYMRWDDLYFYLGVQIKVETRCAPNYTPIWHKDCVFINFMDDPDVWDQTEYLAIQFTIHDDGDFIYEWNERGWYY